MGLCQYSQLYILLVCVVMQGSLSCDEPNITNDQQLLHDNEHLRQLFSLYGEGVVMYRTGLQSLLHDLSDRLAPENIHNSSDHDTTHVTHDHHPHGSTHNHNHHNDDAHPGASYNADYTNNTNGTMDMVMSPSHPTPPSSSSSGSSASHYPSSQNGSIKHDPSAGSSSDVHLSSNNSPNGQHISDVESNKNLHNSDDTSTTSDHLHDHHHRPGHELKCGGPEVILDSTSLSKDDILTVQKFGQLCPSIVVSILRPACTPSTGSMGGSDSVPYHDDDHHGDGACSHHHEHDHEHAGAAMSKASWIGAVISMVLIGLISLCCIMLIPTLKKSRFYVQVNHFLIALAVGTLSGDALIHLLPHAISQVCQHLHQALCGFTALGGIILFLFMERFHICFAQRNSHGHSHEPIPNQDDADKELEGVHPVEDPSGNQRTDKIGEKLSQHSKHNSFIYSETGVSSEPVGCFDGCPTNLNPSGDANGNNESENVGVNSKSPRRTNQHKIATMAECEKLVVVIPDDKNEPSVKVVGPITVPPLPTPKMMRQDSSNFNMVIQEYHVSHHGHSHHGHSHVTGRKDSLRTMILLGDAMHTFMDGMAIGAAYGTSTTAGVATAIAVLCHELPHKVGDFALLFEMGMTTKNAFKMVGILWILSMAGLVFGILLGYINSAEPWIFSLTAGVFLYLALVDLLSEMSIKEDEPYGIMVQTLIQICGMLTGAAIMLVIAIYEDELKYILEGTF